jgi:hypothetical protein
MPRSRIRSTGGVAAGQLKREARGEARGQFLGNSLVGRGGGKRRFNPETRKRVNCRLSI